MPSTPNAVAIRACPVVGLPPGGTSDVDVTSHQICPPNVGRAGVLISNASVLPVFLAFDQPAVTDRGYCLQAGTSFFFDHTIISLGPINAISPMGPSLVTFQEFAWE